MMLFSVDCYAFGINELEIGINKDQVIEKMLKQNFALVTQVDSNGKLNYLFKSRGKSILVEFSNNIVNSVYKTFSGNVADFTARTEELKQYYNVYTYTENGQLITEVIIEETDKDVTYISLMYDKEGSVIEMLNKKSK